MYDDHNLRVFEDTLHRYTSHPVLREAVRKSQAAQQFIAADADYPAAAPAGRNAEMIVSTKRSFEAASAYADRQVCVLNFASAMSPGGGVVRGTNAQEESLCRCSTLYPCLNTPEMWDQFYTPNRETLYALHTDDCIYTPGVVVFKTDDSGHALMDEADWYTVNVITCAAPDLRHADPDADELAAIHEKRLARILDIAARNGNDAVILGAFGCGAFLNDPRVVAPAMNRVVQRYRAMFDFIEFAIYCRPGRDANYRIFDERIRK